MEQSRDDEAMTILDSTTMSTNACWTSSVCHLAVAGCNCAAGNGQFMWLLTPGVALLSHRLSVAPALSRKQQLHWLSFQFPLMHPRPGMPEASLLAAPAAAHR
ncbi:unnamed protein product, partial [Polarella glacialis]